MKHILLAAPSKLFSALCMAIRGGGGGVGGRRKSKLRRLKMAERGGPWRSFNLE